MLGQNRQRTHLRRRLLISLLVPQPHITYHHVGGIRNDIKPVRRVHHVQPGDRPPAQPVGPQQDRTHHRLVRRQRVPPDLAAPVDGPATLAVDVDVLPAKHPHEAYVLVRKLEEVRLPPLDVLAEPDGAQDRDVDVLQEAEVRGGGDGVRRVGQEDHGAAVVALCSCADELCACVRGGGVHGAEARGVAGWAEGQGGAGGFGGDGEGVSRGDGEGEGYTGGRPKELGETHFDVGDEMELDKILWRL